MNHPSGPVDYPSLLFCTFTYIGHILLQINPHWALQGLEYLLTITGLLYNCIKLIDWFNSKFSNKNKKHETEDRLPKGKS